MKTKTSLILKTLFIIQTLNLQALSSNPLHQSLSSLDKSLESLIELSPASVGFTPVSFRDSLEANWIPTENNFFEDKGIILAEKQFESFCKKKDCSDISIPHIIHLIWLGSPPPHSVNIAIESWKKHHPKWEIKLWTDKELESFQWSSSRSENFFKKGKNWAEKSDILRFEILFQFGGIYTDTDVVCLKSFEDLTVKGLDCFAGLESNKIKRFGRPLVGSAIIGSAKASPVMKLCLDYSQTEEEAPSIHQHIRSGPGPITKAFYQTLESGKDNILLLPCSYLYPLPWEKRLCQPDEICQNIRPESFAIHLWEGSWFDSYHPPKH